MKYGLLLSVSITYLVVMEFPPCSECRSVESGYDAIGMNSSESMNFTVDSNSDNTSSSREESDRLHVMLIGEYNVSESDYNVTRNRTNVSNVTQEIPHSTQPEEILNPPKKELPMAMIIAGPAAAFGIMFFLCILYYWHTVQLDQRAKELSFTLYVTPEQSTDTTVARATSNGSIARHQKLVPAPAPPSRQTSRDSDLHFQRRKSTLTIPTMNLPPSSMGKRGSSWSALADQEVLNISSPRRHSTFIL